MYVYYLERSSKNPEIYLKGITAVFTTVMPLQIYIHLYNNMHL